MILEAFFDAAVEDLNGGFQTFLWIGCAANPYQDYFISLMAPVLDRFVGALRRSLPARSDEACHWYIHCSFAILAFVLAGPRCLSGFVEEGSRCKPDCAKGNTICLRGNGWRSCLAVFVPSNECLEFANSRVQKRMSHADTNSLPASRTERASRSPFSKLRPLHVVWAFPAREYPVRFTRPGVPGFW
jgi:hypothetical protein